MAIPQNSHEANARNVRVAVIRLGQTGCAKSSARLMKPKVMFGFSGKIQSAENGPDKMEHHRENRAGEMDVFIAARMQSPVAESTSKIRASASTRKRAGNDADNPIALGGGVLFSVTIFILTLQGVAVAADGRLVLDGVRLAKVEHLSDSSSLFCVSLELHIAFGANVIPDGDGDVVRKDNSG